MLTNKQKGDLYEIQIRNQLNRNPNHYAWLWKDAPEKELFGSEIVGEWNECRILRKNNKINNLPDLGGDLLLRINDTYYIIQCKNYKEDNSVRIEDLAGFFMMTTYNPTLKGIVYYNSKLSHNLDVYKKDDRVAFIQEKFILENDDGANGVVLETDMGILTMTNLLDNMHDYQIEAYQQLKGKHRSILQLPCGMGKTLISMKVATDYDFIIILSPLKEHCQQNLECFKNEQMFKEYDELLIDSDGTRDLATIRSFITDHTKFILSVTFKSVDILNEFIEEIDMERMIVIIDEFHNLSQNDVMELSNESEEEIDDCVSSSNNSELESEKSIETTPMHKLLYNMQIRILFMSATPRIFDNGYENDIECLNSDIFGNIEYSYEMGDAIRNKYITDYELYVPDIYQNNDAMLEGIRKEVNIKTLNDDMIKKIHFLMRGCLETGSRKCIAYFQTQEDAIAFKNGLLEMNEYYYLDLYVDTVLSDDTRKQRQQKLTTFKNWDGIAFLCSVKILDECINIPSCDAIFMANPTNSKIRNIQRISRANRLDVNNPHKISNIFIWADEYNNIVQTIQHLKDFDNSFTTEKIKIINSSNAKRCVNQPKDDVDDKSRIELQNIVVGIKNVGGWFEMFEKVKEYVEKHNCLPSRGSKNKEIRIMGSWMGHQNNNYKYKKQSMQKEIIWTEFRNKYCELFLSNDEKWEINFQKLKQHISEHGCLPSKRSKNNEIKALGHWLHNQNNNYKNKKEGMKNEILYNKWTEFIDEYANLFVTNEKLWEINFQKLKQFIVEHGCLPSRHSNDKLSQWTCHQNVNYKNKTQIMKNEIIYNKWKKFREQYVNLFLSNEETWESILQKLKQFILEHGYLPSSGSTDNEIKKMGKWTDHQNVNYKNKTYIMKNEVIYNKWTEFRQQYPDLFLNNEEKWEIAFQKVQQYVSQHNCLPSSSSNENEIKKLAIWVYTQNRNYKNKTQIMKNEAISNKWKEFIEHHTTLF